MAGSIGQLTPLQVQRLKSELGEVLIAEFCNPRFMDYRADILRSRPATRRQRHEVWQYLENMDFAALPLADSASLQLQQQLEGIILGYIERNPAFKGRFERAGGDAHGRVHQAAVEVVAGFRAYLEQGERGHFGFPRPVESWAGKYGDLSWAAIEQSTRHMQESLLASRADDIALARELSNGSASLTPYSAALATLFPGAGGRPTLVPPTPAAAAPGVAERALEQAPVAAPKPAEEHPAEASEEIHTGARAPAPDAAPEEHLAQPPEAPVLPVEAAPTADVAGAQQAPMSPEELARLDDLYSNLLQEEAPAGGVEVHYLADAGSTAQAYAAQGANHGATTTELPAASLSQEAGVAEPAVPTAGGEVAGAEAEARDTDTSLFGQLQQQVTLWIKVAAVSRDLDITNLPAAEIAAQLRRTAAIDEAELTIATSLLELAERVQQAGQASLLDYKQALMLHLLHRRPRMLI
jgi:hypothetical protein